MSFDKGMAYESLIKMSIDNDLRLLSDEERENLVAMIDEYMESQGWDDEDYGLFDRINLN